MAFDIEAHVNSLRRGGITGLAGAFAREWAERMREDMMTAFRDAIQRPGGAIGRGAGTSRSIRSRSPASSISSRTRGSPQ
jgi:hypothetical protein